MQHLAVNEDDLSGVEGLCFISGEYHGIPIRVDNMPGKKLLTPNGFAAVFLVPE